MQKYPRRPTPTPQNAAEEGLYKFTRPYFQTGRVHSVLTWNGKSNITNISEELRVFHVTWMRESFLEFHLLLIPISNRLVKSQGDQTESRQQTAHSTFNPCRIFVGQWKWWTCSVESRFYILYLSIWCCFGLPKLTRWWAQNHPPTHRDFHII